MLQGPGCLNYALILRITEDGPLRNIASANRFILGKNCTAIEAEVGSRMSKIGVAVRGHTDLALVSGYPSCDTVRKFSGNSQRRHKRFLLFHGTFLLDFNLPLVNELLRTPARQPDYRGNRSHTDFLANLNLPAGRLKQALGRVWNATAEMRGFPKAEVGRLAVEKYSTAQWNFKF